VITGIRRDHVVDHRGELGGGLAQMLEHLGVLAGRVAHRQDLDITHDHRERRSQAVRKVGLLGMTLVALGVPAVFAGAIVTEQIFRVPGIGELLIRSINDSDTPVVAAIVFLFAVLVVLFNLIADVMYAVLDPRIRYA